MAPVRALRAVSKNVPGATNMNSPTSIEYNPNTIRVTST